MRGFDHLAISALGEREPAGHFLRPRHDRSVLGLSAEAGGSASGGLGSPVVLGVVLHATDQECQPPGEHQHLAMLGQGESLVEQPDQLCQPGVAFPPEVGRGHVGVLATEPLDGDGQRVEGGAVDVGAPDALDKLDRVAGRDDQLGLGASRGRVWFGAEDGG
jgi:hypothetical protein